MKIQILISSALAAILMTANAWAAEYGVDKAHSNVNFTIRHLVSKVTGSFKNFEGSFNFDEKKMEDTKVNFTVEAASIFTDNQKRDDHLRSPDFFDTAKHPKLTFVSKSVKKTGANTATLLGDLTIRGTTKSVTWDVEYLGSADDPFGGAPRNAFVAKTKINRKDFGVSWNKSLDKGGFLLGDDVELNIQIEAQQKTAAKK